MKTKRKFILLILFLFQMFPCSLFSQTWEFIKEQDGVQLYSRQETQNSLKSFKGVTVIKKSAEKIFSLIEDVNHTEWWDKNLTQIKVLLYEQNKRAQYYLVYNMPWPFKDRDLYADVTVTIDKVIGEYKIIAVSLSGVLPENDNLVRIKEYRQIWTVKKVNNNLTHVELEFYVDTVDVLPNWLLNMLFVDSPLNVIKGMRYQIEKK